MDSTSAGWFELAIPLTNSRGFARHVRFDYKVGSIYDMPLVISPHIMQSDEPVLTRQALYFLSDIECVIRRFVRLPDSHSEGELRKAWDETRQAADDCLFEFSLKHADLRLTARPDRLFAPLQRSSTEVTIPWTPETSGTYLQADNGHVFISKDGILDAVREVLNTSSRELFIRENRGTQSERRVMYLSQARDVPHVVFQEPPYTLRNLEIISKIIPAHPAVCSPDAVATVAKTRLDREAYLGLFSKEYTDDPEYGWNELPEREFLEVDRSYHPLLLDFYFAGLRSLSPVVEFRSYYNIVEFFFEDATFENARDSIIDRSRKLAEAQTFQEYQECARQLPLPAKESDQIKEVLVKYVEVDGWRRWFRSLPSGTRSHFQTYNGDLGKGHTKTLKQNMPDPITAVADRIYQFRNAVFHSKRTRNGERPTYFRPFSREEAQVLSHEANLLRYVAQRIIQQVSPDF